MKLIKRKTEVVEYVVLDVECRFCEQGQLIVMQCNGEGQHVFFVCDECGMQWVDIDMSDPDEDNTQGQVGVHRCPYGDGNLKQYVSRADVEAMGLGERVWMVKEFVK